jgi:hypothetical protein
MQLIQHTSCKKRMAQYQFSDSHMRKVLIKLKRS